MYEIKRHDREIDGRKLSTFSTEFVSANILRTEAGSTGYCGGDSGHGCRTVLKLEDLAGTDLRVNVSGYKKGNCKKSNEQFDCMDGSLEIVLGGDCELSTFIESLEFAVKALKDAAND